MISLLSITITATSLRLYMSVFASSNLLKSHISVTSFIAMLPFIVFLFTITEKILELGQSNDKVKNSLIIKLVFGTTFKKLN